MTDDIELLPAGRPEQLMILLHGRGQDATAMLPLARAFRHEFAHAALLLPQDLLPEPGPEADLVGRVAAALPRFVRWVRAAQQRLEAMPQSTALVGFGEGATMALEAASAEDGLAGRVLVFGGGYAALPTHAPPLTTLHFLHGAADRVHPVAEARRALEHLGVLHGDATLDIAQGVGHEVHPALIDCAIHRLTHHIPHRTWRAALGALPASARGGCTDD
jgi:phospholipase/carboxylesterase